MKILKKILRWTGVSLGLIFVVLLAAWAIMNAVWGKELRKTLSEIKARGEPTTIAEIVPSAVPDDKNAALDLNRAFAMMNAEKSGGQDVAGKSGTLKPVLAELDKFYSKMKEAAPEERKKMLALADSPELGELFACLEAAARKPGYNQDLKYEQGIAIPLPNLGRFRLIARLLSLKALALADKGDITGACDTLVMGLKIANHLRAEPVLVSFLVSLTCLQSATETINDIADNFKIPEESAKNLIAELGKSGSSEYLKTSLIAERVLFGQTVFEALLNGGYNYFSFVGERPFPGARPIVFMAKPLIKKEYREYLRTMTRYPEFCDRPYYLAREDLEKFHADVMNIPRYHVLYRMMIPSLSKIFQKIAELQTRLAVSTLKLAIGIYKGKNGAFPENLGQLKPDILKEIPVDQLTGDPLVYRKSGDKYELFSDAVRKIDEERRLEREKAEHERAKSAAQGKKDPGK